MVSRVRFAVLPYAIACVFGAGAAQDGFPATQGKESY